MCLLVSLSAIRVAVISMDRIASGFPLADFSAGDAKCATESDNRLRVWIGHTYV